jgi:hypothetical protein
MVVVDGEVVSEETAGDTGPRREGLDDQAVVPLVELAASLSDP